MADIVLTPQADDEAVIDAVLPFLQDEFALSTLAADPGRLDPAFWGKAAELGWLSAALPEEMGGAGFDLAQDMLMHREYGRWLAPVSLLSTALAGRLLAKLGSDLADQVLSGAVRAGFAAPLAAADASPGSEVHLVDATAPFFLLAGAAGASVLPREAFGAIQPVESLDPTLRLARARLERAPDLNVYAADEPISLRLQLLIAAELTGLALAASHMASEYAKTRVQFGKPIGSFQAVAHLCVDGFVRARASDAQLAYAAVALRDGLPGAEHQVVAAAHVAGTAAFVAATNNIQVHGGMGFSAESGAHLYLKRTVLLRRLLPMGEAAERLLLEPAPAHG